MNEYTKGKKLIGKGSFSKVYDNGDDTVTIISNCPTKECMSFGWGNDGRLFPQVERLDYLADGDSVFSMKKYNKVSSLKKSLCEKDYRFYKFLRNLPTYNKDYYDLHTMFSSFPTEYQEESQQLLEMLDALTNYGSDMRFEISPRNVAVDGDQLVLLDCFFFLSKLKQTWAA